MSAITGLYELESWLGWQSEARVMGKRLNKNGSDDDGDDNDDCHNDDGNNDDCLLTCS